MTTAPGGLGKPRYRRSNQAQSHHGTRYMSGRPGRAPSRAVPRGPEYMISDSNALCFSRAQSCIQRICVGATRDVSFLGQCMEGPTAATTLVNNWQYRLDSDPFQSTGNMYRDMKEARPACPSRNVLLFDVARCSLHACL